MKKTVNLPFDVPEKPDMDFFQDLIDKKLIEGRIYKHKDTDPFDNKIRIWRNKNEMTETQWEQFKKVLKKHNLWHFTKGDWLGRLDKEGQWVGKEVFNKDFFSV